MQVTQNVSDSSAVAVLCDLEHAGLDLAVVDGRLRVSPVERLTAEHEELIRQHRDALVTLVRICDQGVHERVTVFRASSRRTRPRSAPSCSKPAYATAAASASRAAPVCRTPASVAAGAAAWAGGWPTGCRCRRSWPPRTTKRGSWRDVN